MNTVNPTLYMMVGVPGSGKSTYIKNHLQDIMVVSTDNYIDVYAQQTGRTYSEVFAEYIHIATSDMMDAIKQARSEGVDVVIDQTNTTVKGRAKKLKLFPGYYKIAVVVQKPSEYELQRRLDSRPGKHISFRVINQMLDGYVEPTLEEGFDNIIFVTS